MAPVSTAPARPADLLARLALDARRAACVTHVEERPGRSGTATGWPSWVLPELVERLRADGVTAPWVHQVQAAELARAGRHVLVGTGTASGKSLAYQLPVLTALAEDPGARALYLAPTKALAQDQLRRLCDLAPDGVRPARYDGDTPREERDWARAHARLLLTNPDMLHRRVLPQHAWFRAFLRGLRFVVVDECHTYRGVFGSHVAQVLRRLRRVCAHYGAAPTFVLASATVADPATSSFRLTGLPVEVVDGDTAPRGPLAFALYEPPLVPGGAGEVPVRRSAIAETGDLLADLVAEGAQTLAFVRSRRGAEVIADGARRALDEVSPGLSAQVAAYRGGYLAEERRRLEADLQSRRLLGVASTDALELGVDVSGLDAVLLAGWPGTVASLWQQAGRAGRAGNPALAVLVARDDPLDTYLAHHPEAVFGRPVEATVLDPANPYVLAPHLECAAAELPLTAEDLTLFEGADEVLEGLVADGRLRARRGGWFWARHGEWPTADLRGTGASVALVELATGGLLGHVDEVAADRTVHEGAVYLHQGRTYLVRALDRAEGVAFLEEADPDYTTSAQSVTDLRLVDGSVLPDRAGAVQTALARVEVTTRVVSYLRRRVGSGEIIDERPLDLPERTLRTRAVVVTITPEALAAAGVDAREAPGALHAAEHAAIGLLPLFATCDRWDIGGISTALHPDTGLPSIFVYDGYAGGAGFAERGHARLAAWLGATRDAISACGCATGCLSCVHSPKCGNGNEPLDKTAAVKLLSAVLAGLAPLTERTLHLDEASTAQMPHPSAHEARDARSRSRERGGTLGSGG